MAGLVGGGEEGLHGALFDGALLLDQFLQGLNPRIRIRQRPRNRLLLGSGGTWDWHGLELVLGEMCDAGLRHIV